MNKHIITKVLYIVNQTFLFRNKSQLINKLMFVVLLLIIFIVILT